MAFPTTLAACSLTPASNGPQGTDLPSEVDDACRQLFALIAQLRDGAGTPVGSIVQLPTVNTPTGYLKMNGQVVSRTTYPALWTFASGSGCIASDAVWNAGTWFGQFSTGDGSTNFRLPDLRAMFTRGLDESRGLDAGRSVGAFQDGAVVTHSHGYTDPTHAHAVSDPTHQHTGTTDTQGAHQHSYNEAANPVTVNGGIQANVWQQLVANNTSVAGAHAHNFATDLRATGIALFGSATGITIASAGVADGHPRNVAYPFFIKY